MSKERENAVRGVLQSWVEPHLGLSLEAAGAVEAIDVDDAGVRVRVLLGFPAARYASELAASIEERVRTLDWVRTVGVDVRWEVAPAAAQRIKPIQGIRNIIAAVLDVLASLLDIGLGLLPTAFGFEIGIVRCIAHRRLGLAGKLLSLVLRFVCETHKRPPCSIRVVLPASFNAERYCSLTQSLGWSTPVRRQSHF